MTDKCNYTIYMKSGISYNVTILADMEKFFYDCNKNCYFVNINEHTLIPKIDIKEINDNEIF